MMKYILVIFVTAVVVFAGAFLFFKGPPKIPVYNTSPVSTESAVQVSEPVSTPTAVPAIDESEELIAGIKAGLVAKYGQDAAGMDVTISKIEGDYAKGMASEQGGGGIWFAAKTGGVWKLVWDGNGIILCSDISSYPDFPTSLIPECWDQAADKVTAR